MKKIFFLFLFLLFLFNKSFAQPNFSPVYETSIETAEWMFFSGFFLMAGLFNFFFYLVARERVYLYFSLFLFFTSLKSAALLQEIVHRDNPSLIDYSSLLGAFYLPILIRFIRYYFQTFRYLKYWDKFLIILSIFTFLWFFLWVFLYEHLNIIIDLSLTYGSWIATFLSLLVTPFLLVHKNRSSTISFLIALIPLIFSGLVSLILAILENRPSYSYAPWLLIGSTAWAVLYFSWALFKRYEIQKKAIAQQALDIERLAKEKELERNEIIAKQKSQLEIEVHNRTAQLEKSLEDLKETQKQLIQSEKMASLGELTAGIAHEIQNPLNFVNNFSEVNNDLINEMENELNIGNHSEAMLIAKDIKENGEKINHHGKRADAIVKGMLQHSRISTGKLEPTDLNALIDEFLHLSYHGIRAKNKSFQATITTDLDSSIGKINIIPQDIGRVLLNIYNNAFYSVHEKMKQALKDFAPAVLVSTRKINGMIEIKVKDNGNGISQKISGKIFQPFFTTKPTGQGTGLGLSISYDIINAHGGTITIETAENEYAEFIIKLPIK